MHTSRTILLRNDLASSAPIRDFSSSDTPARVRFHGDQYNLPLGSNDSHSATVVRLGLSDRDQQFHARLTQHVGSDICSGLPQVAMWTA